jgi:flagellar basal-body rod protein FlgF
MIKGLYTAASGMINLLTANDNIASNLANINTPGFKQGITIFKTFAPILLNKISADGNNKQMPMNKVGYLNTGSSIATVATDFSQGQIKPTESKYDLAIQGDGFFEVENENGKRFYTRDGSFDLDGEGFLITNDGNKVIGQNNAPIKIGNSAVDVQVLNDGSVLANKEPVGKIKITEFENKFGLLKVGENLYQNAGMAMPKATSNSRVIQSALELSNANVIKTMVNSIEGMRTYETLASMLENTGRNLEKTVTQLGRVD